MGVFPAAKCLVVLIRNDTCLPVFLPDSSQKQPSGTGDWPSPIATPIAELTCSTVRSEQGSLDATAEGDNSVMNKAKAMLAMDINFKVIIVSLRCTLSIWQLAIVPVSVLQSSSRIHHSGVGPGTRRGT